jgi:MFS family permease
LGTLASWGIFLIALTLPVTPLIEVDSPVTGAFTVTIPLVVLFLARALDGITGGNVSVANAYLADITEESERSENFGKMAISGNLGFILGPAIAGALGATAWGEVPPVVTAFLISLIASAFIAFGLPDSDRCVLKVRPGGGPTSGRSSARIGRSATCSKGRPISRSGRSSGCRPYPCC